MTLKSEFPRKHLELALEGGVTYSGLGGCIVPNMGPHVPWVVGPSLLLGLIWLLCS